jgi:hypothetical protein
MLIDGQTDRGTNGQADQSRSKRCGYTKRLRNKKKRETDRDK